MKLLKVTAASSIVTLVRMLSGFFVAKAIAVYAGPGGMVMFGQVQSLVSSFNGIVSSPAGSGVVRYTAKHVGEGYEACAPWWRAALQWQMLLMFPLGVLACIFAKTLAGWSLQNSSYSWLILLIVIALPFTGLSTLITSVINGQQQYRRYFVLGMVSSVLATVVMLVFIVKGGANGALVAAALYSAFIGFVMLFGVLGQPWMRWNYWWGKVGGVQFKGIGGYVCMAVVSAITSPVSLLFIRNILIDHVGWEQAGYWQSVWKISEVYLGVITMGLGTYYLPRLSSLRNIELLRKEITSTVRGILPIVVLLALGVYLLRDVAISVVFTEAFRPARDLFAVQMLGDVVKILSWLYAYSMLSHGATKWFVFTEIIFSISFVGLAYGLVHMLGVQGANWAYAINYSLYFVFIFKNLKRFARF